MIDSIIYYDAYAASDLITKAEDLMTDELDRARIIKRKAIFYRIKSRYKEALTHNLEALSIFEKENQINEVAEVNHNIGFLMRSIDNYETSLEYYKEAIRLREVLNDSTAQALSHREIGVIYRRMGDFDSAEFHYGKAMTLFDAEKDKREIITLKGNYATLYGMQKKYDLSIEINKDALRTIKTLSDPTSLATRYGNIAVSYRRLKKYDQAITYIDSALQVSRDAELLDRLASYYNIKAVTRYKQKEYKKSYVCMRKYKTFNDSLNKTAQLTNVENQLQEFEYEKRRLKDSIQMANTATFLENELRAEKVEKRNLVWVSSLVGLSLISLMLWQYTRVKVTRLKVKNDELAKKVLKSQLVSTKMENDRLVNNSHLHYEFKKSVLEKIDNIKLNTKHADPSIRDLQRELLNQMRIENEAKVLNEAIHDYPAAFDEYLRETYPSLTKGERKVCFLVKSEMSIKDIANINQTSSSAIQSMRYRIRKKLGLAKGEELKSFLQNLQWRKV